MTVAIYPVQFEGHSGYCHVNLHGPYRRTGVVICSAPGRDGRCGYRFQFDLAQKLAQAGSIVLRFDPLGCGNSDDLPDPDGDAIIAWQAGLRQAAALLRRIANVDAVVLAGVRFSGTVALLCSDVADGLMVFAPVIKGKAWIRELKIARAVLAPTKQDRPPGDGLDADGLVLSPASLAHVNRVHISADLSRDMPVFLAAQNADTERLGDALREKFRQVRLEPFDGFVELFEDTSRNRIPQTLIARAADWLASAYPCPTNAKLELELPVGGGVIETAYFHDKPVEFGEGLRGNWCAPTRRPATDLAVIICNTSAEPRAGIGGYATALARHLARGGVSSLRFDFAGVGDSDASDDSPSHVYETPREKDFQAATALAKANGITRMVAIGVCSGGFHALHQGIRLNGVEAVVAINTLKFVWDGDPQQRDLGRSSQAYWERAKDPKTWGRLLRNHIDLGAIAKTLSQRLAARMASSYRKKAGDFRTEVAHYLKRGGRIFTLLGTEDASLDGLEAVFGPQGQRLLKAGGTVMIDDTLDHGLALQTSRERALRHVCDYIEQL